MLEVTAREASFLTRAAVEEYKARFDVKRMLDSGFPPEKIKAYALENWDLQARIYALRELKEHANRQAEESGHGLWA